MRDLMTIAEAARAAKSVVARLGINEKNCGLHAIADTLTANTQAILAANQLDIAAAKENGLNSGLIDRLTLTEVRICDIAEGCRQVAALPDPIGEVLW